MRRVTKGCALTITVVGLVLVGPTLAQAQVSHTSQLTRSSRHLSVRQSTHWKGYGQHIGPRPQIARKRRRQPRLSRCSETRPWKVTGTAEPKVWRSHFRSGLPSQGA